MENKMNMIVKIFISSGYGTESLCYVMMGIFGVNVMSEYDEVSLHHW